MRFSDLESSENRKTKFVDISETESKTFTGLEQKIRTAT
jgi:hypothetical protein